MRSLRRVAQDAESLALCFLLMLSHMILRWRLPPPFPFVPPFLFPLIGEMFFLHVNFCISKILKMNLKGTKVF